MNPFRRILCLDVIFWWSRYSSILRIGYFYSNRNLVFANLDFWDFKSLGVSLLVVDLLRERPMFSWVQGFFLFFFFFHLFFLCKTTDHPSLFYSYWLYWVEGWEIVGSFNTKRSALGISWWDSILHGWDPIACLSLPYCNFCVWFFLI